MQVQSTDYVTGKVDEWNTDENSENFLDDYYPEVDADEIKENSEIESNDYQKLV